MYKVKTGNPHMGHEKKMVKSVRRGELVQLATRVKPLTLEVLKDVSARECISIGELLDRCIFENVDSVLSGAKR